MAGIKYSGQRPKLPKRLRGTHKRRFKNQEALERYQEKIQKREMRKRHRTHKGGKHPHRRGHGHCR